MKPSKIFEDFGNDLKNAFPETTLNLDIEKAFKDFDSVFFPEFFKIVQKDDSFFSESPRMLFDVDLSNIWKSSELSVETKESIWKHIQYCLAASLFNGNLKEKVTVLIPQLKTYLGNRNDEVSKLLEVDKVEDKFSEILEYVLNTRIYKVFSEAMETFDFNDIKIDAESPEEVIEIVKNADHPVVKKLQSKIQNIIKNAFETGKITQQQITNEIESLKAKVTSIFGNVFNDMLGGTRSELPSTVLMGNSPEARRQRMLARLQKKQRDKNSS